jgi:hypothetical protein
VGGILHPTTQTVTIYSPHPITLLRHWATIQQAHTEIPENGASETSKHVGVNECANTLVFEAFVGHLFII